MTTPYRVGCEDLFVLCRCEGLARSLLLDRYLGSQTEGDTYCTLLHHPFLYKGKTNASSRSSRKNFWRRCRGDLRQVKSRFVSRQLANFWRRCRGDLRQAKTYQVPIISLIPRITLFAIRLSFSPPPLLKRFLKRFAFFSPLFRSPSSFAFCVLVCWIA